MSCTTCPTTSCTCCHVPNVTIDSNLTVGQTTVLNTCGNTGGALTVNTSSSCIQTSGDLVTINGETGQSALNVTAGTVNVAESITCQTLTETSDASLKTNVSSIEDALQMIKQLEGVRFDWRASTNAEADEQRVAPAHIGLLAQNVQSVCPAAVSENPNGYLSVSYTNLVAVLVEAVKELSAKVDALELLASGHTKGTTMCPPPPSNKQIDM